MILTLLRAFNHLALLRAFNLTMPLQGMLTDKFSRFAAALLTFVLSKFRRILPPPQV